MDDLVIHVIPIGDLKSHDDRYHMELLPSDDFIHPVGNCQCNPKIIKNGSLFILVHDAHDGRLGVEWASEILKKHSE